MIRSSAFSLAFGYVALGIISLVLFAAPLWYAWRVTINDGRAELLEEDTQRFSAVFQHDGPSGLIKFIDARVGMQIAGERVLLLADAAKRPLAGNLPVWPGSVPDTGGTYTVPVSLGGHPSQMVVVRTVLPGGYNLLVGRDLARFAPLETRFWYGLAGAVGILIMVGVVAGMMLRRALMARILGIDQTVSAIMRGDLGHRLDTRSSGDELDTLAITINKLLDQIEQLIHGIRNVSNAIAHDLRTPLAELRSRLETLALTQPPPQETFAELDGAVADVDRVIRIFNALLRLAEIDTGMRRSGFVAVDAASIVAEAVDLYLPATELKGITLRFRRRGEVPVAGDPVLLAQAVGNLIDNALKYVNSHGHITIDALSLPGGVTHIAVLDDGPGITDEEKPRVIERFYRGAASSGTPGVGLGLTLVDAVARLHGGRLELADNNPGLCALIVLGL